MAAFMEKDQKRRTLVNFKFPGGSPDRVQRIKRGNDVPDCRSDSSSLVQKRS